MIGHYLNDVVVKELIRDFQKWLPSNKWRHSWGTEQTGTNDVTEYQAENHL